MSLFLSLLNDTRTCLLPGHLLNPSQSIHFRLFLPELHLLLLTFSFRLQMTLFISTLNDNFALPSCRLRVWAQWAERACGPTSVAALGLGPLCSEGSPCLSGCRFPLTSFVLGSFASWIWGLMSLIFLKFCLSLIFPSFLWNSCDVFVRLFDLSARLLPFFCFLILIDIFVSMLLLDNLLKLIFQKLDLPSAETNLWFDHPLHF